MRTGTWPLILLGLAAALPAGGQDSPIQWPVPPPAPPRETVLSHVLAGVPEIARALAAGAVPLDARGTGPYAKGHLPGAVPAWAPDRRDADPAAVRERLAALGISGRRTVVVYGEDHGEDREGIARLYWLLRRAGCSGVLVLDGGIAAWRAAGRKVETGLSRRPAARAFLPSGNGEAAADADWIAGTLAHDGVQLLDTRDARGWERWETPPTFGAGHIPYALPFDPRALLPASGGWPDPAGLRRRIAELGPRPGDPIPPGSTFVLYGEGPADPRPALGYLLLTLAGFDARVFPGGWTEWTASGEKPTVKVLSAVELAALLRREDPELAADRPPRGLALLDLREPRDFQIGHLPGALGLPFDRFAAELDATVAAGWPGALRATLPLVLYCYGIECVRSRKAGAEAARRGWRHVLWLRGGVREWRDAGYPLPVSPSTAPAAPPPSRPERGSPADAGARP
jgi:thiosulfate/3-mercaptopyruvate sulfurtransferase